MTGVSLPQKGKTGSAYGEAGLAAEKLPGKMDETVELTQLYMLYYYSTRRR